jgi:gliding motility-associated protein GldL
MTFAEFAETKKFKTIMNYVYSLGAAVVILGALFKIMHWPGANLALIGGMGTEVLVFTVFAIDPTQVHLDLDWSLVYPELAGMHDEEGKEDKKSITEQLDNMLEEAKIGPDLIESLGSGLKSLSDNTAKLTNLSDASVAANDFTDNMKSASKKIGTLSDTYDKASSSISGSISDLEKASSKTSQALDLITNSTQQQAGSYSEQLQKVSKNLGSLNSAYELQLQNSNENIKAATQANAGIQKLISTLEASMQASQRDAVSYGEHLKKSSGNVESLNAAYELQLQTLGKANQSYQNFEKAMSSLGDTTEDAKKFKVQLAAMSENLGALNTVYGNMLTAMSIGRK